MKKKIFIDHYKKEIKEGKLEIINTSSSSESNSQETITNLKKDKIKFFLNEKEEENNSYCELNCQEELPKIKTLIINNKNIIQINLKVYTYLINLQSLDLSHNNISTISKKIIGLQNLKILNFSDNFISYIPPFLKELKYLSELNLSKNSIELIPTSIQFFPSLKILNISQNLIEKLPMELGLINKLENLSIDRNDFTEIPTTFCYLQNLKALTLEWFEFLDPELPKNQKDKEVLQTLKKFLENKLMNSIMSIDFHTFIIKMSKNIQKYMEEEKNNEESKSNEFNFNLKDVFYALNNNYFGVIKSFVNDNKDLIRAKDLYSGKNLLYLSIQQDKKKVYEYLISKIDFTTVINNSSILFRAIRSRNYNLFLKLVNLGFSLETLDLKGNNVYHVLFSSFSKNYEQCVQIGNYLIQNNVKGYNALNYDGWAPIHTAAKYGKYICFEWIGYINKILESQNREKFDINILGKNNHTAFHLACSTYKYSECKVLLNLGAKLLLRGTDGKLPKNTTYNYFLTKMLFMREQELFYNKYIKNNSNIKIKKKENKKQKITATFDNCYDTKNENRLTFINSERSKSEIICSKDKYTLLEKYQILMTISLSNDKNEITQIIKNIFKDINFKFKQNFIIICEILGLIQNYNLYEFYQFLKNKSNNSEINSSFIQKEIKKVLIILEKNKGKKPVKQKGRVLQDKTIINNINKNNKTLKLNSLQFGNKFLNKTETDINYYVLNSNSIKRKNNNDSDKKFVAPGFQKLKEKKVQESITSIDFEE